VLSPHHLPPSLTELDLTNAAWHGAHWAALGSGPPGQERQQPQQAGGQAEEGGGGGGGRRALPRLRVLRLSRRTPKAWRGHEVPGEPRGAGWLGGSCSQAPP
jgi:hypothetical protein